MANPIKNKTYPKVAVIMGSDSDLSVMKDAVNVLNQFGIAHEVKILSAHRTPDETIQFAKNAERNNLKIIIAAAGGAAHLPGVISALTNLPVIGVPIKTKSFNGMDSLLSIVQMPSGIPVATMAVDGSKNAAILACKILALNDKTLRKKLNNAKDQMKKEVLMKAKKVHEGGIS